jgi:hypothetical protein
VSPREKPVKSLKYGNKLAGIPDDDRLARKGIDDPKSGQATTPAAILSNAFQVGKRKIARG